MGSNVIRDIVIPSLEELWKGFSGDESFNATSILDSISEKLKELSGNTEETGGVFSGFFRTIGELLSELKPLITDGVFPLIGGLFELVKTLFNFISDNAEGLKTAIGGIVDVIVGLVDFIAGLLTGDGDRSVGGFVKVLEGLVFTIYGVLKTLDDMVTDIFKGIFEFIANGLLTLVEGIFGKNLDDIQTKVSDFINGVDLKVSDLILIVTNPISLLFDDLYLMFSNFIERIKNIDFPGPHISYTDKTILGKTISIPNIEWYDRGGIFTGPQIIGVGEKRPEFVGALEDLGIVFEKAIANQAGILPAGENVVININHPVVREENDIRKLSKQVIEEYERYNRNNRRGGF